MSAQAPSAVILIRATRFVPNPATAADNAFQADAPAGQTVAAASAGALAEMDALAEAPHGSGVRVHVFDDDDHTRPDSVFPNNWLSTHAGGTVAVYPMYASNRRHERRSDVLEMLKSEYRVQAIVDYSGLEPDGIFLEGTGAMVLDHVSRVAYAARSYRADVAVLERFCTDFNYEPMAFDAVDSDGIPVYHTNVIACVGTHVALFALDMIPDEHRRQQVRERLAVTGRTIVELTEEQIREFAGNAVELCGRTADGRRRYVMAMSARAKRSLRPDQVAAIEESCEIVAVDIPTIELAGGSVRCMIAGVHLDHRRPLAEAELSAAVAAINEDNPVTPDGRFVDGNA
ncbi:arginine deiminase-related protein [Mycobacterium cookii]